MCAQIHGDRRIATGLGGNFNQLYTTPNTFPLKPDPPIRIGLDLI